MISTGDYISYRKDSGEASAFYKVHAAGKNHVVIMPCNKQKIIPMSRIVEIKTKGMCNEKLEHDYNGR